MKTITGNSMSPILALIIGKVLDYLAENSGEIVKTIRQEFGPVTNDPKINAAIQELGYNPSESTLVNLHDALEEKGENPEKLAAVLVSKTVVDPASV